MNNNRAEIERYGSWSELEHAYGPIETWPFSDQLLESPQTILRFPVLGEGITIDEARILLGTYQPGHEGLTSSLDIINPYDIYKGFINDSHYEIKH